MIDVTEVSHLENAIQNNDAVAVMFTRSDSPESTDLIPRVRRLFRRFDSIPVYHVDIGRHPTAASEFLVYGVPTIMVYYRGTPAVKHVGDFYLPELRSEMEKLQNKLTG
jgi:thioredoxin-like negative regulator of GroEL